MQLDGIEIKKGDKVFDILEEQGEVIGVGNKTFSVSFVHAVYKYDRSGNRKGTTPARFPRLLYWQNPFIMIPIKDDNKWEAMKKLFFNSYKIIREL